LRRLVVAAQETFLVDEKGKRSAVLLPMKDYQRLLEDLHDLAVVAERRDEAPVDLAEIKRRLIAAGAEAALLSGSGATVFGVFGDETTALRAQEALGGTEGWRVFAVPASSAPLSCETGGATRPAPVG